MIKQTKVK